MKNAVIIIFILLPIACTKNYQPLAVVPSVDIKRYSGTWYEIARLPNRFEKDLICVTATYTIRDDGRIDVLNQGIPKTDRSKIEEAKGIAKIPDAADPAKLKVSFFWPFSGDYWILDLDDAYQYVLIGEPSRKFLWILARQKQIEESVYQRLSEKAKNLGFDTSKFERVPQDCP